MNPESAAHDLQWILSYVEKSQRAGDDDQLTQASRALDRLRKDIERQRNTLSKKCERLHAKQSQLAQRAAKSKGNAQRINAQNRSLLEKERALKQDIETYERLLRINTAEVAGGFLDLPWNGYKKVARKYTTRIPRSSPLYNIPVYLLPPLAVAALILTLWQSDTFQPAVGAQFDHSESSSLIGITIDNRTEEAIQLHLPWIDGVERTSGEYGFDVYVQEESGGPYRLAPPADSTWQTADRPGTAFSPIEIGPLQQRRITFNPGGIQFEYAALRLELSGRGGVLARHTVTAPTD